ncbi:hypothetical protein [Enterococcus malodoratus]|uniref:hypothetical protein n=1 Tax=Enterococcus malodoratus TaxID=71451 RepID=UPI0022E3F130|nr:hypothetical protein [Enterococcus malodoratus]
MGITQSRVRNLKIKKELVYPEQNYNWKEQFLNLISFAQYDEQTKKIIMNIPDPNLQIEIENHIEQRGLFIERQLNSKLLQIRVEYFIELVISLDENISQDKLVENMKAQISELSSVDKKIMKKGFGKVIKEKGISAIELLAAIVTIAPAVQPIIAMINQN